MPINTVKIRFPFRCISKDNEKIQNKAGRYFLSKKFKDFERAVKWVASTQAKGEPFTGDLKVNVRFSFTNKKHGDLLNLPKGLMDSLEGILYANDRQIKKASIEVFENSETDWFEVEVRKMKYKK